LRIDDAAARAAPERLSRYLPHALRLELARGPVGAPPFGRAGAGAVVWVDITGFTALVRRCTEGRPGGVERLGRILDRFFGALVHEVESAGGDVVGFAGDAVMALWSAGDDGVASLEAAARCAALCALDIQGLQVEIEGLGARPVGPVEHVRTRVYAGAGALTTGVVGEPDWRAFYLVAGDPILQIRRLAGRAQPGEAIVSRELGSLLPRDLALPGADGVTRLRAPLSGGFARAIGLAAHPATLELIPGAFVGTALLRALVPRHLAARIEAGLPDWAAEVRRVSVVFAAIPERAGGLGVISEAQAIVTAARGVVEPLGGEVLSLSEEDKGAVLMVAFGLPGLAHEDDAARALRSARGLHEALGREGRAPSLGVATGPAFCGSTGGARRQGVTVLGDVTVLAARLTEAARGRVLCCESTRRLAGAALSIGFAPLPLFVPKGFPDPVQAYEPEGDPSGERSVRGRPRSSGPGAIIGRAAERAWLRAAIAALPQAPGSARTLVLRGEAGIGKTTLLASLEEEARERGLRVVKVEAHALERSTPHFAWRAALGALLDGRTGDALRAAVLEGLADAPRLLAWAPLLGALLPLDLPETELTGQMTGHARLSSLHDLVTHLLSRAARTAPLVIAIDDAHWLDSTSWTLALRAAQRVAPALVVVCMRPEEAALPHDAEALLSRPGVERRDLARLPEADVEALVARRLGVRALPPALARLILAKAEGNPFVSEELAVSLVEAGHVKVAEGACAVDAEAIARAEPPATVQGIVTSRLDRLDPHDLLLLKVASVLGRVFALDALAAIHPTPITADEVRARVGVLAARGLTRPLGQAGPASAGADERHEVGHAITQDVAYGLLTPSQRRLLHRSAAEWCERAAAEVVEARLPLIAHHWRAAEDDGRALFALDRAGRRALEIYANEEALRFLEEAAATALRLGVEGPAERAPRERLVAEAHLRLSRLLECRAHLHAALEGLEGPVPARAPSFVASLARELATQARSLFSGPRRVAAGLRPARRLTAHLHQQRAEVAFFVHDLPSLVHGTLAALNRAEAAGASTELAHAYGTAGIAAGVVGLDRLARSWHARAIREAERVGHLPTTAYVHQLVSVYHNGVGDFPAALSTIERAAALFERTGDRHRWQECMVIRAYMHLHQGLLVEAERILEAATPSILADGALQTRVWCRTARLAIQLGRGIPDEAATASVEALLPERPDPSQEILCRGLAALARWSAGERGPALDQARRALAVLAAHPPTTYYTLLGIVSLAQVLVRASAPPAGAGPTDQSVGVRATAGEARDACRRLLGFARMFPVGAAYAHLVEGERLGVEGRARAARSSLEAAVREARRLGLTAPLARAHGALGRLLEGGSSVAARERRERAARITSRTAARRGAARTGSEAEAVW